MKIFISHAPKDSELARQLAGRLGNAGLTVVYPGTDIEPGKNWAKKVGSALQTSEFLVFLLTPGALESEWLRKDIEFALGSKRYDGRVFSIVVGPTLEAGKDMPWILLKLPHCRIGSARGLGEAAKDIVSLCTGAEASSPNA